MSAITTASDDSPGALSVLERLLLSTERHRDSRPEDAWNAGHRDELIRQLWSRLSYPKINPATLATTADVVHAYVASHEHLEQFEREAQRLIDYLQRRSSANSVSGVDSPQPEYTTTRRALTTTGSIQFTGVPRERILFVELLEQPQADVQAQLLHELRWGTEQFVDRLFAVFDRLVQTQIIGVVDQTGPDLCRLYSAPGMTARSTATTVTRFNGSSGEDDRGKTVWQTTEVMCAEQRSVTNSMIPLPLRSRETLAAIPDWLLPWASVIRGEQFRTGKIQCELRQHGWKIMPSTARDEIQLRSAGGVVLGDLLLTVWEEPLTALPRHHTVRARTPHGHVPFSRRCDTEARQFLLNVWQTVTGNSQPLRTLNRSAPVNLNYSPQQPSPPASSRPSPVTKPVVDGRTQRDLRQQTAQRNWPWPMVIGLAAQLVAACLMIVGCEFSPVVFGVGLAFAVAGLFPVSLGLIALGEAQWRIIGWWAFVKVWGAVLATTGLMTAIPLCCIAPSMSLLLVAGVFAYLTYYSWSVVFHSGELTGVTVQRFIPF